MLKATSLLTLAVIIGLCPGFSQNGKSPDAYAGNINDLLTKEVGGFKLASTNPADAEMLKALGATAGSEALYQSADSKKLLFILLNFPSAESARAGLKTFKKHEFEGADWAILDQGAKQKNGNQVGDRVVVKGKSSETAKGDKVVLWTNGSLLLIVGTRGVDDDTPLDFEKNFSY